MWNILYTFRTGDYHFRKQAPIGPYYADFACHHARLVIEVDGETHGTELERQHDARRDAFLRRQGHTVLRFTNIEIAESPDGVHVDRRMVAGAHVMVEVAVRAPSSQPSTIATDGIRTFFGLRAFALASASRTMRVSTCSRRNSSSDCTPAASRSPTASPRRWTS